jgi:hypothetical protein
LRATSERLLDAMLAEREGFELEPLSRREEHRDGSLEAKS